MAFRRGSRPKDYGGNAHGGKPYRNPPGSTLSYQCRDCRKVRYVSRRELNRAAKPRCLGCGGPLVETNTTAEKTMSEATAENAKALNEAAPDPNGHCRCWGCELAFRKNYYLGKHLEESESCRQQYKIKNKLNEVSGGLFYAGTFAMLKQDDNKIHVVALSADIQAFCDVAVFGAIWQAEDFIGPYTISLQATRIKQHWREQPKPEPIKSEIRCPVCRSRFVDTNRMKAQGGLELHLAISEYCFAHVEAGPLKEAAAQIRGSKRS